MGQQAAHAHTFVRMVTDRWKCRNNRPAPFHLLPENPEVPFCLLVVSNFAAAASSPFIAISRSAHLSGAKIHVDNLLRLH